MKILIFAILLFSTLLDVNAEECDPLDLSSCSASGGACYINVFSETTVCALPTQPAVQQNGDCEFLNSCAPGLSCVLRSPSETGFICTHHCDPDTGLTVYGTDCSEIPELSNVDTICAPLSKVYSDVSLSYGVCVDCSNPPHANSIACSTILIDGFEGSCDSDVGEPNTEAEASFVGSIADCDVSTLQVSGVLGSELDTDYYYLEGTDEPLCDVSPTVTLEETSSFRTCLFLSCVEGSTELTCPSGAVAATSESGHPGCCTTSEGLTLENVNCTGLSDDATVWLRLDQAQQSCVTYSASITY